MRTVSLSLLQSIMKGVENSRLSSASLLEQAGVDPIILKNKNGRIALESYARIATLINTQLEDETLGLFSTPQKTGTFKHLAQSCINAKNIEEAIKNSIELLHLVNHPVELQWIESKRHVTLRALVTKTAESSAIGIEYFMSALYRFFCWLADSKLSTSAIEFSHNKQKYDEEYFHFFLGSSIKFNGDHHQITFDKQALNTPVRKTPSALRNLLRNTPVILLINPVNKEDIASGTRVFLEKYIKQHAEQPEIEQVTNYYNMSKATYRRALNKQGITYNEIKQQVKRDLAIFYLTNKQYTAEKTAQMIGFSETSAFVRAFKSWTGMTPASFRKQAS